MKESDKLHGLQALRFIAAMMVVSTHAPVFARLAFGGDGVMGYRHFDYIGMAGVDIFFVLSGLIIWKTIPKIKNYKSGLAFFWKRWTRVVPVYWLASIFYIIPESKNLEFDRLVASVFFWPVAGHEFVYPYAIVGWTLCFEFLFYSVVCAGIIYGKLKTLTIAAILMIVSLGKPIGLFIDNPILLEFALGIVLAQQWSGLRQSKAIFGTALVLSGFGIYIFEALTGIGCVVSADDVMANKLVIIRVICFGGPAYLILAGILVLEQKIRGNFISALAMMGDASYAIYLVHWGVLQILAQTMANTGISPDTYIAMAMLSSAGIGLVFHLLVEKPLIKIVRSLTANNQIASSTDSNDQNNIGLGLWGTVRRP